MLQFNNRHIFTGYLKQLLKEINLPSYRIYTKEYENYFENNNKEHPAVITTIRKKLTNNNDTEVVLRYVPYIKNGILQVYVEDDNGAHWEPCKLYSDNQTPTYEKDDYRFDHNHTYFENKWELNNTKNFIIKNNIYDTYTHEYLGEYLRFQRDYYGLNLMPLYNCFSNNIVSTLNLSGTIANSTATAIFNSADTRYKIYAVPVKFFKKYTIAIDSSFPIELGCCIYQKYLNKTSEDNAWLLKNTYKKYNSLKFDSPVTYDKLVTIELNGSDHINTKQRLLLNEPNLRLLIKLPANNTSSITILEGSYSNDYNNYNNRMYLKEATNGWTKLTNKVITNFDDNIEEKSLDNFNPITPLQLLQMNSGISYPFSDNLIEYLSGNAITLLDEIPENIKRIQKILKLNKIDTDIDGNWTPIIQPVIYNLLVNSVDLKNFGPEILGFIDKNAETNVKYINYNTGESISIGGVELDEEEKVNYGKYN